MKKTTKVFLALLLSGSFLKADVYAVVNGEKLTDEDLKPMLSMFYDAKSVADLNENEKKMIIDQGIEKKLILQETVKEKIDQSTEFQKIVNDFSNRLKIEFWMKKQLDTITVSEAELKADFEKNVQKYGKDATFDAVKTQVEQTVKMQKFQVLIDKRLSSLKKEAKIEYKQ